MELICKHFSELTASELYEIYRLRVSVFVVEQNCAYQDVDEAGLLPADLCRGVLTEDALFDLLGDTDLLHGELTRVAREACARTKFIVRPVMTTKHARRAGGLCAHGRRPRADARARDPRPGHRFRQRIRHVVLSQKGHHRPEHHRG